MYHICPLLGSDGYIAHRITPGLTQRVAEDGLVTRPILRKNGRGTRWKLRKQHFVFSQNLLKKIRGLESRQIFNGNQLSQILTIS